MVFWTSVFTILENNARSFWANKDRFLIPLFFSICILLLFNFTGSSEWTLNAIETSRKVLSETHLVTLFVMQLTLMGIFEDEERDSAFGLFRLIPQSLGPLYVAKLIMAVVTGFVWLLPFLVLSCIMNPIVVHSAFYHLLLIILELISLCSLGVFLSSIMRFAKGKDVLYPLLFFPLAVPVLICSFECSLAIQTAASDLTQNQAFQWLCLLCSIAMIYTTLSYVLFLELYEDDIS